MDLASKEIVARDLVRLFEELVADDTDVVTAEDKVIIGLVLTNLINNQGSAHTHLEAHPKYQAALVVLSQKYTYRYDVSEREAVRAYSRAYTTSRGMAFDEWASKHRANIDATVIAAQDTRDRLRKTSMLVERLLVFARDRQGVLEQLSYNHRAESRH